MGRPKGSRNKVKTSAEAPDETTGQGGADAERGFGDNGPAELTDDQRRVLLFQHVDRVKKLKKALDEANSRLRLAFKVAKSDLGDTAKEEIKVAIEGETEEGEAAIKARVERQTKILSWLGTPVGAQLQLFPSVDPTPAVERARAAGKLAGMKGETCSPPFDHTVPQHDAWLKGWREGQDLLMANLIKPLPVEGAAEQGSELIPAGEQERRDAERLAKHDARGGDDPVETTQEAEARVRREGVADAAISGMASSYGSAAADLDISTELRRTA